MSQQTRFKLPDRTHTLDSAGNSLDWRRVGYELEFSGIGLDEFEHCVIEALGGERLTASLAERLVKVDGLGEFNLELDWSYLKRKAAEHADNSDEEYWLQPLSQAAAVVVPMELVCPPIPLPQLDRLDAVITALRESGAVGTSDSLVAAYGVHINIEIPRLDAATIFDYLRAFALMQWWLVEANAVDMTRRLTPYIDLYPEAYLKRVLSRSSCSMDELFDDYLEFNASRNRALDMLPMLSSIDAERVQRAVEDPRVNARPAFHYRLPDCHIEQADWSLADGWNLWWLVEQLANRPRDLDSLAEAFLAADRALMGVSKSDWVEYLQSWLQEHELV